VEAARRWGVKVRVRSTFKQADEGTLVVDEAMMSQDSTRAVAGIACDKNQARVAVIGLPDQPGMAARLFKQLAEKSISVDMIIQSIGQDGATNDIAFTVNTWDLQNAETVLKPILKDLGAQKVLLDDAIAKVSIVGVGMIDRPGVAASMFQALAEAGINIGMSWYPRRKAMRQFVLCTMLFLVKRPQKNLFRPNWDTNPTFFLF
jgi:aspartate kinase